jgi:hypothetical protein
MYFMILFFENGRLGNQLFQYHGFKNYFPKQQLFFFGCKRLKNSFDNLDVSFIDEKNKLNNLLFQILKKILNFLSEIGFLGKINQLDKKKDFKLNVRKGLLWNIYVAQNIYFQHNKCIKKIIKPPIFKNNLLKLAQNWLKNKNIFPKNSNLVFVHVRRGDYLSWPHPNFPAVLDLVWYEKAMSIIKKKINKPIFIIMGDDPYYLQDAFKESKSLIISKNSPEIDLAIMSKCFHGILSPSSFAWWGAFFIKSKRSDKISSNFIAPKFWAGHRLKKFIPQGFFTSWITYIN